MVHPRGFEPLVGRPAGFIDAGFTDRWQEKDAGVWLSRRDLNARPPPSDGDALDPLSYGTGIVACVLTARSLVAGQVQLISARAHEYEQDVARDDQLGTAAAAEQRQSGTAVGEREIDRRAMIGALRLHRDMQEFTDRLVAVLQPQLRRDLLGAEREAQGERPRMNVGERCTVGAKAELSHRDQDQLELAALGRKV